MKLSCYALYFGISVFLAVFLGRTLHREGRLFLLDCLDHDQKVTDAVNDLLLAGFYLVNIAWIALTLVTQQPLNTIIEAMELLTTKIGIFSLLLGGMHYFNMFVAILARQQRPRRTH